MAKATERGDGDDPIELDDRDEAILDRVWARVGVGAAVASSAADVIDDEPSPGDAPEDTKARRPRRSSGEPRTPPNVSAAAARVARGEGTSADQRLLRAWERRQKGGTGAPSAPDAPTPSQARGLERLSSLDRDWSARLKSYDDAAAKVRRAAQQRLAGQIVGRTAARDALLRSRGVADAERRAKVSEYRARLRADAESKLATLDGELRARRPGEAARDGFVARRVRSAFDRVAGPYRSGAAGERAVGTAVDRSIAALPRPMAAGDSAAVWAIRDGARDRLYAARTGADPAVQRVTTGGVDRAAYDRASDDALAMIRAALTRSGGSTKGLDDAPATRGDATDDDA